MMAARLVDAVDAWRGGRSSEAERLVRDLLAREPRHVDAQRLLLELLSSAGRTQEALVTARCLVELAPQDAAAQRRLAELLSGAGDGEAAIRALERSLELEPNNSRALSNLGNLLTTAGRVAHAIEVLERAVDVRADYPAALVNLGLAYVRAGQVDRAIGCYRRALTLNPRLAEASLNLAGAYRRIGDLNAALTCYERARTVQTPRPELLLGQGEVLLGLKQFDAALTCFEEALKVAPGLEHARLGQVHALLGLKRPAEALIATDAWEKLAVPPAGARALRAVALLALDRVPEALRLATDAAAAEPDNSQAFVTLGFAALRSEIPETALSAFDTATRLAPALAKAHLGRGNSLEVLGRAAEAIVAYQHAARLDPSERDTFSRSANLFLRLGNGVSALSVFESILAVDPEDYRAQEGRAKALMSLGRSEEALSALTQLKASAPHLDFLPGLTLHAQLCCCAWEGFADASRDIAARIRRGERADVPFMCLTHQSEPDVQRLCAQIYVAAECAVERGRVARATGASDPVDARLRVGYLSADFRNHAVGQLVAGLIDSHDRTKFEIYAFSAGPDDGSELRRRLVAAFEHFEEIATLPDEAVARRIAELGIDILVDLGGHTFRSRTRVLAYRPAAVQISFLGFPGTLGADFVDYFVADRHVIPDAELVHYAESVIYMSDTCLPTDFARPVPALPSRALAGLPEDAFVFCVFNSAFKITPDVFRTWMRVLKAVPHAVLWLRDGSEAVKRNLAREASAYGVDAARLLYAPRVPRIEDHLARFALADLFLDTFPYNAHTTASEALAVAVPVVTLRGRTFASRVATSLLHAVTLGHLSVDSMADYERVAVDLARSPAALDAMKTHLRRVRATSPLFDTRRFCLHLEKAFAAVIARARRGEARRPLYVEAAGSSESAPHDYRPATQQGK
jgi:predicted O-linked N-acetylglucosamine transferase (SPINDLY family)